MLPLPKFFTLPAILSNLFPFASPGKPSEWPENWIMKAFYGVIGWSLLGAPNWQKVSVPQITLPTPAPTTSSSFITSTTSTPLKSTPLKARVEPASGILVTCPSTIQVVNIRQGAGLSTVLATVPCGDRVNVLGSSRISSNNEVWVPVEYKGTRGWATARYLSL